MATPSQWFQGARPKTLPAALAPVLVGTGAAAALDGAVWWKAGLALIVALALQVGVNYANDYSDGVRGTDAERVGPLRLVGSGVAEPHAVKHAAYAAFAVAALAGLVLAATSAWWLLAVGAICIVAAWYYTGGSRPYGYAGLGEVMVFVFFGLVAVMGTTFVQLDSVTQVSVAGAVGVGALACAILVANNLRDIPTDTVASKLTLAVRLGDRKTRQLFVALQLTAALTLLVIATLSTPWVLLGFAFALPAQRAIRTVLSGASGPQLIPVLERTGAAELLYGVGAFAGLLLSA